MTSESRGRLLRYLAFALLAYGVICLLQAPGARRSAAAVPRVTLDELLRRGATDDQYVTATGLKLAGRGFAFWRDAMSPGDVDVFVPVYSTAQADEPSPERLEALLEVQDEDEWGRIRSAGLFDVTARVRRGATDVEAWARDYLAERYAGLRWESLIVLTTGLHEPTPEKARSLLIHGVVSGVAGIALLAVLSRGGTRPPHYDPSER